MCERAQKQLITYLDMDLDTALTVLVTAKATADCSVGYLHWARERATSALYLISALTHYVEDTSTRDRLNSRAVYLEFSLAEL